MVSCNCHLHNSRLRITCLVLIRWTVGNCFKLTGKMIQLQATPSPRHRGHRMSEQRTQVDHMQAKEPEPICPSLLFTGDVT